MKDHDPVNKPSHYTQGNIECIDAIESALGPPGFVAFLRGQVIKYNWRMMAKDNPQQDAEKAAWYQNRLVQAMTVLNLSGGNKATTTQGAALTEEKEKQNEREISRAREYNGESSFDPYLSNAFRQKLREFNANKAGAHFRRDHLDPRTNDGS